MMELFRDLNALLLVEGKPFFRIGCLFWVVAQHGSSW